MYDNKVRLSEDVLQKAEVIAAEWGLKNARAAVEAVFRKYADDYLYGRLCQHHSQGMPCPALTASSPALAVVPPPTLGHKPNVSQISSPLKATPGVPPPSVSIKPASMNNGASSCEAIDALDDLLAL